MPNHPKITPEYIARMNAEAERIDADEQAAIVDQGRAFQAERAKLQEIVATLKAEREAQGVSLSELSRRTGIAKPNLSTLERDAARMPTLATLDRIAAALGRRVEIQLVDADS